MDIKCRGCKFNTDEACSAAPGDIVPPTCPSLFARFEALASARAKSQVYRAKQRARILAKKTTSCRQCTHLFKGSNLVECTINNLEFDALSIPDSCPLEVSYETSKERVLEGKSPVQRVLLHIFMCTLVPFVMLYALLRKMYPYRLHVAFFIFIWWLV